MAAKFLGDNNKAEIEATTTAIVTRTAKKTSMGLDYLLVRHTSFVHFLAVIALLRHETS